MTKKIILFITMLVCGIVAFADEPPKKFDLPKTEPIGSLRPLSDFSDSPSAVWMDGVITIEFPQSEGMASVAVSDFTGTVLASVSSSTAIPITIYVGYPEDELTIRVETTCGNTYEGYFSLD